MADAVVLTSNRMRPATDQGIYFQRGGKVTTVLLWGHAKLGILRIFSGTLMLAMKSCLLASYFLL